MLASGPAAAGVARLLGGCGGTVAVLPGPPGAAATRKLLRSVFYKGMAAAVVEALRAAEAAGQADWLREHIAAELAAADADTAERLEQGSYQHARPPRPRDGRGQRNAGRAGRAAPGRPGQPALAGGTRHRLTGPRAGRGLARGPMCRSEPDAENPAVSGTEAEAVIGDVERPIRADGHAGREHQARDDSDW